MANASAKRLAVANKNVITLHQNIFVLVVGICFAFYFWAGRSFFFQLFLASPGFGCAYLLRKWCYPRYDARGQLISPGHDFDSAGVVEYLKDVVYLTLIALLCSAGFGIKAWFIVWGLVPIFAGYKVIGLLKMGWSMLKGQKPPQKVE